MPVFFSLAEKANTTEIRYAKLKEKHNELINTHAELLRKVMVPVLRAGGIPRHVSFYDTSVVIVKCLPHFSQDQTEFSSKTIK